VDEILDFNDSNSCEQSTELRSKTLQRQLSTSENTSAQYQAVYEDLKRLARRQLSRESPFTDLPITMLVHESYARMAKLEMPVNRNAFFSYASRAMRSIIVDYVRNRQTAKRDAIEVSLTLAGDVAATTLDHTQILSVDRALVQLETLDKRAHDLVELRYFAGFTLEECAQQLGISMATATRDWQKARAFLGVVLSN
jgi:RNA polymerase sigma factor (TIGR02999 family)